MPPNPPPAFSAVETEPWPAIQALQVQKLQAQLAYLAGHSTFYQRKLGAAGVVPSDIRSPADLQRIPFTTKQELRAGQDAQPPFGTHQAAAMQRIVRMTSTAGTTGKPVFQGYTKADIARRNESICRGLWAFGVRPGDRVINGFALSMFNAGVPFCTGIETLGAVDVPVAVHCCAASPPLRLFRAAGASAVSVDTTLGEVDRDAIGELVEGGTKIWLGVVPALGPGVAPTPRSVADPVRRLWRELGFDPERLTSSVALTPTCGLAGASPGWVHSAYRVLRQASNALIEAPEGIA